MSIRELVQLKIDEEGSFLALSGRYSVRRVETDSIGVGREKVTVKTGGMTQYCHRLLFKRPIRSTHAVVSH